MSGATDTFYGYRIDRIMDDGYESIIGYDVMDRGAHADDEPLAEMLPSIAACKEFIREEVKFRRTVGRFLL